MFNVKHSTLCLFVLLLVLAPEIRGQQVFIDRVKQQLGQASDPEEKLVLYFDLAKSYRNLNAYIGLDYIDSARNIAIQLSDTLLLAQVINEAGVLYRKVDLYEEALDQHQKALRLFESMHDTMGIAFAYANMGNVFLSFSQLEKALEYNQKSLDLKYVLQDSLQIAYSLRTTALVLQALGRYDEAIDYFAEATAIYKVSGNKYQLGNILYHLGDVNFAAGKHNQALIYFGKALQIYNELESLYGSALVNLQAGTTYLQLKQYDSAERYFKSGLRLAEQANTPKIVMDACRGLSELNKEIGNYQHALTYFEKYALVRDSLFSENFSKNVVEMQAKYQNDEQLAEIALLKKENELIKNEQRLKSAYMIMLFVGILFALIVLGLLMLRYGDKKKINAMLEKEIVARKINEQQLMESERQLTHANQTKDKFFSIISHDLKSPFGAMTGLMEILQSEYDEMDESERKELICEIGKAANNTYSLLSDLLAWSQTQRGTIDFNPKNTNIKKHCKETVEYVLPAAKKKNITLLCKLPDNLDVNADLNMVTTIIRNLLSNAVKFTPKGGQITVSGQKIPMVQNQDGQGHLIEISVSDNGIGICPEDQEKLFKIEEKLISRGTENESGTGLGLVICKEFVEKHNCSIRVESEPGNGSKFIFTLPPAKPSKEIATH